VPTSFDESAQARRDSNTQRPIALLRRQLMAESAPPPPPRAPAPKAARKALSRPPCVTPSQMARAGLVLVAGLIYANHPQLFRAGAVAVGTAQAAARAGVDPSPTGAIARAPRLPAVGR